MTSSPGPQTIGPVQRMLRPVGKDHLAHLGRKAVVRYVMGGDGLRSSGIPRRRVVGLPDRIAWNAAS